MADASRHRSAARATAVAVAASQQRGSLAWPVSISPALAWPLASLGMMLAPALWNGFPLIFPDTGGYFTAPMLRELANGRSALYGFFLDLGIPLAFWPCIVAQAAMTVWLFAVTLRVNGLGGRPWLALMIVTALSVVTSLPWFAAQLMPDILFSAAVLALYLLAYAHDRLTRGERYGLAAIVAFAMASHMALAGLCVAIVAAFWLVTRIKWLSLPLALPKPRLAFAGCAVAAGILLCPVSNVALTGSFAFTPGGTTFLFGRLIEDGVVARYLEDRCPDPDIRLCAYRTTLPTDADGWLWGDTPLYELGGWQAYEPEERRIIRETLLRYPVMHLTTAVTATFEQFVRFATEVSVEHNEPTFWSFREHIPQWVPALMSARQQTERFDVDPLNLLHVPVAGFAIAALGLALVLRRRVRLASRTAALAFAVLVALAANAAICGVFSHPVDRYQSRLVLLAPFAVAVLLARRLPPGVKPET